MSNANVQPGKESPRIISRTVLVAFCLVAGLSFRLGVALISLWIFQGAFLLVLSAVFLAVAVLARRTRNLSKYWEIPLAFFVFTITGADDALFLNGFIAYVLNNTTSAINTLKSTILTATLTQLV